MKLILLITLFFASTTVFADIKVKMHFTPTANLVYQLDCISNVLPTRMISSNTTVEIFLPSNSPHICTSISINIQSHTAANKPSRGNKAMGRIVSTMRANSLREISTVSTSVTIIVDPNLGLAHRHHNRLRSIIM